MSSFWLLVHVNDCKIADLDSLLRILFKQIPNGRKRARQPKDDCSSPPLGAALDKFLFSVASVRMMGN
jgi:hypothetical protein